MKTEDVTREFLGSIKQTMVNDKYLVSTVNLGERFKGLIAEYPQVFREDANRYETMVFNEITGDSDLDCRITYDRDQALKDHDELVQEFGAK